MNTSTQIHKTRKWLLIAVIVGIALILYALFMSAVPLAFALTVAGITLMIMVLVKLIALYVHRYSAQSHTPAWRPGDKT